MIRQEVRQRVTHSRMTPSVAHPNDTALYSRFAREEERPSVATSVVVATRWSDGYQGCDKSRALAYRLSMKNLLTHKTGLRDLSLWRDSQIFKLDVNM